MAMRAAVGMGMGMAKTEKRGKRGGKGVRPMGTWIEWVENSRSDRVNYRILESNPPQEPGTLSCFVARGRVRAGRVAAVQPLFIMCPFVSLCPMCVPCCGVD